MKDLWQYKREFLEHCEIERGQSKLTVENYGRYLDRFLFWLEENQKEDNIKNTDTDSVYVSTKTGSEETKIKTANKLTPELITDETVRQYRLYINRLSAPDGGELKLTTQNHHVLALRAFLRYLLSRGVAVLPPEKISLARTGEREINFLNKEEYIRLLKSPDTKDTEGVRDRAVLETLFSTGMRVSEIVNCNIGRLNLEQGEISILGKGKRLRVVFLSESARYWLVKYLIMRGAVIDKKSKIKNQKEDNNEIVSTNFIYESAQIREVSDSNIANDLSTQHFSNLSVLDSYKNDPLFLSSRGNRLNARAIERLIKKYKRLAGISKDISPHSLRHTFATDLLSGGADIRSVQSMLGHSNLSTTQIYTHVTDQHLREVHRRFHATSDKDSITDVRSADSSFNEQNKKGH